MNKSNNAPVHISSHRAITMDFTTTSGKHLRVRVPLTLFDDLSLKIGNAYKANCWIVARCNEVERLSHETIERYVNMMARQICQQVTMPSIEVQAA
jgi:hypothetical protein